MGAGGLRPAIGLGEGLAVVAAAKAPLVPLYVLTAALDFVAGLPKAVAAPSKAALC